MAETTTLPELGPIASDIKSRLVALETGASGDYVTTAQLGTALEGKLDKTGVAAAATKASQDADGNPIKATYATKEELRNKQDKGDYLTTGTANTTYLKKTDAATTYLGISSNAASASIADRATKDGLGNVITETYATKSEVSNIAASSMPISYGTEPLKAGVSELATGSLYFVYE